MEYNLIENSYNTEDEKKIKIIFELIEYIFIKYIEVIIFILEFFKSIKRKRSI